MLCIRLNASPPPRLPLDATTTSSSFSRTLLPPPEEEVTLCAYFSSKEPQVRGWLINPLHPPSPLLSSCVFSSLIYTTQTLTPLFIRGFRNAILYDRSAVCVIIRDANWLIAAVLTSLLSPLSSHHYLFTPLSFSLWTTKPNHPLYYFTLARGPFVFTNLSCLFTIFHRLRWTVGLSNFCFSRRQLQNRTLWVPPTITRWRKSQLIIYPVDLFLLNSTWRACPRWISLLLYILSKENYVQLNGTVVNVLTAPSQKPNSLLSKNPKLARVPHDNQYFRKKTLILSAFFFLPAEQSFNIKL